MSNETHPTPCTINVELGGCTAYRPGHMVQVIQANFVGHSPWGWRDGVVVSVATEGWIEIDYVTESARVVAWHHAALADLLSPGTPCGYTRGTAFSVPHSAGFACS
jgi:hypothetical protein